MKITNIETILAGQRYLFVKVHTDTGLVGYGECGAWCYQEATAECIHAMEHHLIGLDPLNIEYINNGLTRCMHFRGSVVMAAISGIDIALWDLKGKYYNAPIYELLGGKVRDKARIYVNFKAKTPGRLRFEGTGFEKSGLHCHPVLHRPPRGRKRSVRRELLAGRVPYGASDGRYPRGCGLGDGHCH